MSNLDPLILDIFGPSKKCPFCPLRAVNFKHETRNTKKWVCDHYAHKTRFWPQKNVTELFGGWFVEGIHVHLE